MRPGNENEKKNNEVCMKEVERTYVHGRGKESWSHNKKIKARRIKGEK